MNVQEQKYMKLESRPFNFCLKIIFFVKKNISLELQNACIYLPLCVHEP